MTEESKKIYLTLPQSVRVELANNLYRTEEILWAGTPSFRRTDDYGVLYYFISIIMFGATICMYYGIAKTGASVPMEIVLFLMSIACGSFMMPSYQLFMAKRTGYIITNSRAIIIKPDPLWPWNSSAKSYRLTTDLIVGIKMDGTRGDIIFGESVAGYITSHMGNGLSVTAPSKQKYGFIKCPKAKEVADFIYEYAQYLAANQ